TTAPTLSSLHVNGAPYDSSNGYYYLTRPTSGCAPPTYTDIVVTATDPDDAVAWVRLYWLKPNAGVSDTPYHVDMYMSGTHVWTGTLSAYSTWTEGVITYWVQAGDSHGNTSATLYYPASQELQMVGCIF
ncbi:MAG: hypothetical protein ACREOE_04610, partial [Gemmatimonadales bacterium]